MIEAMACGTPVIAFCRGSVPEVIEDGVSGFVVDSEEEAVAAVKRLGQLDRSVVRAAFERRFTARRMAEDYVRHYGESSWRSGQKNGSELKVNTAEVWP
jgi:glycosyltransferase involved in cell wall biosynthesis